MSSDQSLKHLHKPNVQSDYYTLPLGMTESSFYTLEEDENHQTGHLPSGIFLENLFAVISS
jgi:hypothetical protein